MGIENPVHLLFFAIVALVVLGPKRLPELARAVGKGVREFREAIGSESAVAPPPPVLPQVVPTAQSPTAVPAAVPASEPPAAAPVDPAQPVRSEDAPDRRPL
jgi:TatA/E family protein of Tat protein translocase